MFGKIIASAVLVLGLYASAAAGDAVRIDFNFWNSDALIVPVGPLPEGVTFGKRVKFRNPDLYGFATLLYIDLGKTQSVDLKFTVRGKSGRIKPSATPIRIPEDKNRVTVECTGFEFCNETTPDLPRELTRWTNMACGDGVEVGDGDTITLKAAFKAVSR